MADLRGTLLVLALALAGALASLNPPPPQLGRPLDCARAQLIDAALRCDAETVPTLAPGDELVGASSPSPGVGRMAPASLAALQQRVDVNSASVEELTSLPGIGPTIAARIVAGRPYADLDALLDVKGIGPKRLAAIRGRAQVIRPEPRSQ